MFVFWQVVTKVGLPELALVAELTAPAGVETALTRRFPDAGNGMVQVVEALGASSACWWSMYFDAPGEVPAGPCGMIKATAPIASVPA